jgi:hypothetical protein
MNQKNIVTTTKHFGRSAAIWPGLALLALAFQLMAHGGFDHVIGTVVKVENNVLTVKTAKGNVDVLLNDKTEITRNDQKALAGDLTPGIRVIVDIPEGSKDKIAHLVKLGVSGAHAHDASN